MWHWYLSPLRPRDQISHFRSRRLFGLRCTIFPFGARATDARWILQTISSSWTSGGKCSARLWRASIGFRRRNWERCLRAECCNAPRRSSSIETRKWCMVFWISTGQESCTCPVIYAAIWYGRYCCLCCVCLVEKTKHTHTQTHTHTHNKQTNKQKPVLNAESL